MINSDLGKLIDKADSRYALVIAASKRARQINSYNRACAEGSYTDVTPPMIENPGRNELSTALDEIEQGKLIVKYEDRD